MTSEKGKPSPGEPGPYVRRAGPGSSVWYMGCLFSVLAGAEDTGGRFGLLEMVATRGREPSRHLHLRDDEGFYVLKGEVTFYAGDETYRAGAGSFVFLPRGIPHLYTFESEVVRMLAFVSPGGIEGHFRDPRFSEPAQAATLPPQSSDWPDESVMEEIARDLAGYDTVVVGPPGPPS